MQHMWEIGGSQISPDQLYAAFRSKTPVRLSESARLRIQHCRNYLEERLESGQDIMYGINTGFGYLCDKVIAPGDLRQLQLNLLRSHACGLGAEVPADIVRLMLLLKVQSLAYGHSGVCVPTAERLLSFYNHSVLPVVYTQGSLGASGDLAPLAHLCLPLIGEGEVRIGEEIMPSAEMLKRMNWQPVSLEAKEGLALLNGTQFMLAYGIYLIMNGLRLAKLADKIAALSLDAFGCRPDPFHPALHRIRPHAGQQEVASRIRAWMSESPMMQQPKNQVQDPYSFRCIPQVHGATYDTLQHVYRVLETELNSVSDNPNIFPEEDLVLSGGNFHGQPLALALDFLAIALAELASISERRSYQLLSGSRGLPLFLVANPGLNSGLMIAQYTAASIVSQNKQYCSPASIDTIPSSNNQEDHVSMGANAAVKCLQVLDNLEKVLSIELLCASQALHFREPSASSPELQRWVEEYRALVPPVSEDRYLHHDIVQGIAFLRAAD
ncbi:MAG: histidine ammonia-lyase [Bacteroidetes bacterium]|nr:MAG: histidine ammonia-lyase [Bacteroidota bacterium]